MVALERSTPRDSSRPGSVWGSRTIRGTLIWMVIVCLLPAWVGMAVLIQSIYQRERDRAAQNTMQTARALVQAVDRQLAVARTAAEVLSKSAALQAGDLAAFHSRASEIVRQIPGNNMVLTDESGQQLLNTLVPYGDPLPMHGNDPNLRAVFATGRPSTSDLFIGPVARRPLVAVEVPVFRDGRVKYALAIALFSDRLGELLERQDLPPGWIASIFDSSGTIVARTHSPATFVGHAGSPALTRMMAQQASGFLEAPTLEGLPVYAAFSRSEVSRWAVAIGVPAAELDHDLYLFLWLSCAGALFLLAVGIALAGYQSRRMASAVQALVEPAMAFGRGEAPRIPRLRIREIDQAAQALGRAFDILQRRTDERDKAEHEKKIAEDAARAMKIAAEEKVRQTQKLETIGQLTGGIAHDFNNILTVITGTIDILTNAVADRPKLAAVARMISEAADRGSELTQRLLAFARKQPLQPRRTDVNALIVDTAKLLRPTLGEHVEIEAMLEPALWPALVDRSQLSTALLNLAVNARDAMPEGGKLTLETDNVVLDEVYAAANPDAHPGPYVLIAVSDTGSGIPAAIRDKVFEPFFTTKEVGKGTGLGLSMVYGFVRQSDGHIKIYSEEGQGATIRLYFPRIEHAAASDTESPALAPLPMGGETILVVEDDALVRDYVIAQLASLGYGTLAAANGAEALALVEQETTFDLLFTDVIMPGMNGRQLADQVCRRRPAVGVLYTSGYAENAIQHHGRLDPGVLLLAKPYRKADLARMIRLALASRHSPLMTQ